MTSSTSNRAEQIRGFFLAILFISIPFSIAGGDFAITGLYLVTLYLFIKKQEHWQKTPILTGILVLLAGAIISSLFSEDLLNSFSYFKSFWRFGLPFLVLFALRDRPIKRYLLILAVISSLIAIYAIVQFFTGLDVLRGADLQKQYRPLLGVWFAVGAFSHHLTYGGVSLLVFAVLTPLGFDRDYSPLERLIFAVGSFLNLAAVVFCMGRSIWVGAAVAIGIMILFQLTLKRFLYLLILAILIISGLTVYQIRYGKIPLAKTALGYRLQSAMIATLNKDRLMMWQAGINIIKDHPFVGLGPNANQPMLPYYKEIEKQEKAKFQHQPGTGVHNIYIQNWINFGLVGLAGYLLWWLALLYKIALEIKKPSILGSGDKTILLGILAGLIGSMFAGFFENNFRDGEVQITILVLMGIGLSLLDRAETASQNNPT